MKQIGVLKMFNGIPTTSIMQQSVPTYFVIKYVDDVFRMETKNIGVILWTPGSLKAAYLDAITSGGEVQIDRRKARHWCKSVDTYYTWIHFWERTIESLVDCLDLSTVSSALIATNKNGANYWVVEGGRLLDEFNQELYHNNLQQLYDILVLPKEKPTIKHVDEKAEFNRVCDDLLNSSLLSSVPGFKHNEIIKINSINNRTLPIRFSYTISNGSPRSVIQKLTYSKKMEQMENKLQGTAWKMEQVVLANQIIKKENALVLIDDITSFDNDTSESELLNMIADICNLTDMRNKDKVLEEFTRIREEVLSH